MVDLDDIDELRGMDPAGMLQRIAELPQQVASAWEAAGKLDLPTGYARARNVVVLGMGGSAIGGDLLRSLVAGECMVPIQVSRDYELPAFVGADTLVIACSYSGNTEETLTALHQAEARGAMVLASTSGGTVLAEARQKGYPVYQIHYKSQPRAALAHGLIPLLAVFQKLGFVSDYSSTVQEAVETLESLLPEINEEAPTSRNIAKQTALLLFGRLPVVYGGGVMGEVAHRWKTQLNENSKSWAFFETLPELNHNAVLGYQFPAEISQKTVVLFLRASSLHSRIALRYDVTAEILTRFGVQYESIDACGRSALSQMLSTILLGDYISCYLAFLYRVDPTPVETIDYLKTRLGRS